jgi:signal-transduction protein with cAMP-binding, CBS, and nucleotidyltransferase domain
MTAGAPATTLLSMTALRPRSATFLRPQVADVVHEPAITFGPETPIQLVARRMAEQHVCVVRADKGS